MQQVGSVSAFLIADLVVIGWMVGRASGTIDGLAGIDVSFRRLVHYAICKVWVQAKIDENWLRH